MSSDILKIITKDIKHPIDMNLIWKETAPILQYHFEDFMEINEYWNNLNKFVRLVINNDDIPNIDDNIIDLYNFVYENKSLFRICNLRDAINFINNVYNNDIYFFSESLIFSIENPILLFDVFLYMEENRFEKWEMFKEQRGNIERFIDLFSFFITSHHDSLVYQRVMLCELVSKLVIHHKNKLFLSSSIFLSLYTSLLNVIRNDVNNCDVPFIRIVISLVDAYIQDISVDNRYSFFRTLYGSCLTNQPGHNVIVSYLVSIAGKYIPSYLLIDIISENKMDLYELIAIKRLVMMNISENINGLSVLFKIMVTDKVYMRAASQLLSEILSDLPEDELVRSFLRSIIFKIFIFIKIGVAKGKYINRISMLCLELSSDKYINNNFMKELIFSCAASSYNSTNMSFITEFFPFGPKQETLKNFANECKYYEGECFLKTFPFRPDSYSTCPMHKKDCQTMSENSSSCISDYDDYDIEFKCNSTKFLVKNSQRSKINCQNSLYDLKEYSRSIKELYLKLTQKKSWMETYLIHPVPYNMKFDVLKLSSRLIYYEDFIKKFQMTQYVTMYEIAEDIISILNATDSYLCNIKLLKNELAHKCKSDKLYSKRNKKLQLLKNKFTKLMEKVGSTSILGSLRKSLKSKHNNFDKKLDYAPYFEFDEYLVDFLLSSGMTSYIEPLKDIFVEGSEVVIKTTTHGVIKEILNNDLSDYPYISSITRNAFLRYIFDSLYASGIDFISNFGKDDEEFCNVALEFANRKLEVLKLPQKVTLRRNNVQICNFFKSSKYDMSILSYMTNPFDILYTIHTFYEQTKSHCFITSLTHTERESLLLGCLVTHPPSNTISIIMFIKKFNFLVENSLLKVSYDIFSRVVSSIYNTNHIV